MDFRPFEGLEYDLDVAGPLDRLLSPPYDVVDSAMRERLLAASPYNIVRIILPRAAPGGDMYAEAARLLRDWRRSGVLRPSETAFYIIEQRFSASGRQLVRTAVAGHVRLSPWREGGVYPHEVTLPRPKADRLELYRATRLQPGPGFSLFEDATGGIAAAVAEVKRRPPYRTAEGPEGSSDSIWKVGDKETLSKLRGLFEAEKFFIADGHHRYETALAYRSELAAGGELPEDHPADFVFMCAVPFDDPGLLIFPTHRLIARAGTPVEEALRLLREDYEIGTASAGARERAELLASRAGEPCGIYAAGRLHILRMKDTPRAAFAAEAGELMAALNVYEARKKILSRFFDDVDLAAAEERIGYTHDVEEALRRVDAGELAASVILSPLGVRQMAAVAAAGRTMPPKSTYFYPKLPTGVVLKPV